MGHLAGSQSLGRGPKSAICRCCQSVELGYASWGLSHVGGHMGDPQVPWVCVPLQARTLGK